MNPAQDALYRVHQFQASRRGQPALPYDEFCARLQSADDTNLTGLLLPPTGVRIEIVARREPRFSLGRLCITPNAATAVPADEVLKAVARHAAADWGTLDEHDWQENDRALRNEGRLFSAYQSSAGLKFWVITEGDRHLTTVMLPEDY